MNTIFTLVMINEDNEDNEITGLEMFFWMAAIIFVVIVITILSVQL